MPYALSYAEHNMAIYPTPEWAGYCFVCGNALDTGCTRRVCINQEKT